MEIIESSFGRSQITSGPPPLSVGVNEESGDGFTYDDLIGNSKARWYKFRFEDEDLHYVAKGSSTPFRQRIVGSRISGTPSGKFYLVAVVETFLPARGTEPRHARKARGRRQL